MVKYWRYVLLSIVIIVAGGLFWVQNHPRLHAAIAHAIKDGYEQATGCTFNFNVARVNLLRPEIVLERVSAQPKDIADDWHWQCATCVLHFSWLNLLLYGTVDLQLTLNELSATTGMQAGNLTVITNHVARLAEGPPTAMPIYLKSIVFNNAVASIHNHVLQSVAVLSWSSESKKIVDQFKTHAYIKDGSVSVQDRPMAEHLAGSLYLDIASGQNGLAVKVQANCTGDMLFLPEGNRFAFVVGTYEHGRGTFSIKTPDQSCVIDPIAIITENGFSVQTTARMPLATATNLLSGSPVAVDAQCQAQVHVHTVGDTYGVCANIQLNDAQYRGVRILDSATIALRRDAARWHGTMSANWAPTVTANGTWEYDEQTGKGTAQLQNAQLWIIPELFGWQVGPEQCAVNINFDNTPRAQANYALAVSNPFTGDSMPVQGTVAIDKQAIGLHGTAGNHSYDLVLALKPQLYLQQLSYKNEKGQELIAVQNKGTNMQFEGMIKIPLIRALIRALTKYDVQGEGDFTVKGIFDLPRINLQADLAHVSIRLPQTHNFISDFHTDIAIDVQEKKVTMANTAMKLHRGNVMLGNVCATFNEQYGLKAFELPVVLDSCLLNIKKDVFALISGGMIVRKKDGEQPALKGKLSIDRSLIHENLFSDKVQKAIFSGTSSMFTTQGSDMRCDVTIETKNPVRINTAFVEAQAKLKLHVQNTVQNPQVTGSIDLVSGALDFPYKSLNIVRGNIFFMPHQLYDPLIELVARNTIKKHTVTLNVTGSLLNPHVALESNPPLSEEQIVGLLLVGSQADSLNVAVPALIMQNLKTLLFESEHSPIKLGKLKDWLKPFKYIHLVPSFSDQSGRGGLRGAVEVELGDRVHATLQKNFSLSEDTKFEVEYALSDELSLRALRNERKDVGGEVEMRWKFGG